MNRSYLCCCDHPGIYPSSAFKGFDPEKNTVATDAYCVPLLWLALFRSKDLRTEKVATDDGDSMKARAPLAETAAALKQLREIVPLLNEWFKEQGPLDDHAAMLEEAILAAGGRFVTIEWSEIEMLAGKLFTDPVDKVYAFWDRPDMKATAPLPFGPPKKREKQMKSVSDRVRVSLLEVCQMEVVTAFTSPRGFWHRNKIPKGEDVTLCRLLGTSHIRPCPWDDVLDAGLAGDDVQAYVIEPTPAESEQSEKERMAKAAASDAAITSRVCPFCGKPCPSYRKTCKHCGKSVLGL